MTGSVSFECSSLGNPCEWRLRASTAEEVQRRFREHARCAHGIASVSAELASQVTERIRPV